MVQPNSNPLQEYLPVWWFAACGLLLSVLWLVGFVASTQWVGFLSGLLIGFVGATVVVLRYQQRRWLLPPWLMMDSVVLVLVLAAVVATGWSSVQPESAVGLVKMLLLMALYPAMRWLLWACPGLWQWQVGVWLALGVLQAIAGWGQVSGLWSAISGPLATWQDPTLDSSLRMTRIVGTIPPFNPNLLAGVLIPVVGLALGQLLASLMAALRKDALAMKLNSLADTTSTWASRCMDVCGLGSALVKDLWAPLLLVLALVWALVMTGSRGGFLALAAMGGVLYLMMGHGLWRHPEWQQHRAQHPLKQGWLVLGGGAILAVLLVLLSSESLWVRVASIITGDSSTAYRMQVYHAAWRMIADNALWGIGPGNLTFQEVYGLYQHPMINALAAYSVPLEMWIETGLPGFLAYAAMVVLVLWQAYHRLDDAHTPWQQNWASGAVCAALVGVWVYGLFDTVWYRPTANLMYWAVLASWVTLPWAGLATDALLGQRRGGTPVQGEA